jgi:cupin 2 domain-containing protein
LRNLFADLPAGGTAGTEEFRELLARPGLKIERIVSAGHASPPGFWYDQSHAEWVVVLRGQAKVDFEGGPDLLLEPGDFIHIAPHRRHRVAWTDPDIPTVWLAIHYGAV